MTRTLAAHDRVAKAVAKGKLTVPERCEKCNKKRFLEAHHEDYTKPLEVQWLCQSCHRKTHTVRKAVRDTMSTRRTGRGRRMKLLSTNRVAEILEVSPRTVAKWIRDGELKGVKMYPSKNWRVEEAELERFIASRRVSP